jgi:hypothetical protein
MIFNTIVRKGTYCLMELTTGTSLVDGSSLRLPGWAAKPSMARILNLTACNPI